MTRLIKPCLLIFLFLSAPGRIAAQVNNDWYLYHDAKSDLYGYKDLQGNVKVKARFNGFISARVFKNIAAVRDDADGKAYYLLKNGRKVGLDSLYVSDMTYDCEQEGKIRFRDSKTDRVGFFGSDGKIRVPAKFNDASPFYNGLAVALYEGKRICSDGSAYNPKQPCEHWSWSGKTALIDSLGNIIADNIDWEQTRNINWYAMKVSDLPADTSLYESFKTNDGRYNTFINYEKEFNQWFYNSYLSDLALTNLSRHTFQELSVEGIFKNRLRKTYAKAAFIKQFGPTLQAKLTEIRHKDFETVIFTESLNLYIEAGKSFKVYYTDCGEANDQRYPAFDVVTTHYKRNKEFDYQEHFAFLRTADGYKLISMALKPAVKR